MSEKCMIHVVDRRYGRCKESDIAVYVLWKGRILPICGKHWVKLVNSRREWSSDSTGIKRKTKRRRKK